MIRREFRVWTKDGQRIWIRYNVGEHESKLLNWIAYSVFSVVVILILWMLSQLAPGTAVGL